MDKVIIDGIDISIPVKLRPNRKDLTGKKYGKLTVIKPVAGKKINGKTRSRWLCQCECGTYTLVYTSALIRGNTKSCGCGLKQHYTKQLQAENERLKRIILDNGGEKIALEKDRAIYIKVLQEIRDKIKDCNNGKCFSCEYNEEITENCVDKLDKEIIDKINSVIGAEEWNK